MEEIKENKERKITKIGGLYFKGESEFLPDKKKTKYILKNKNIKSDKVIRYRHWSQEVGNTLQHFKERTGIKSNIEAVKKIKEIFNELNDYGINIPKIDYALSSGGKRKSKEVYLYQIAEKIKGKNFLEILDNRELTIKYQKFIEKIIDFQIKYLSDKIKNKELFLYDISFPETFLIGKQNEDKKEKIYFVDFDPIIISDKEISKELLFKMLSVDLDSELDVFKNNTGKKFKKLEKKLIKLHKLAGLKYKPWIKKKK